MVQQNNIFEDMNNIDDEFKIKEDEYNLWYIGGSFGHGKTAFLTYLAVEFRKEYDYIFANYKIDLPNAIYLNKINKNIILSLNLKGEYNCLLLLMEAYQYFDKRVWNLKENKGVMKALFQIRKLNIDIACDIPRLDYLDFRPIENGNAFFYANGQLQNKEGYFLYSNIMAQEIGMNIYDFIPVNYFTLDMKDIYDKYNTFERIHRTRLITEYIKENA